MGRKRAITIGGNCLYKPQVVKVFEEDKRAIKMPFRDGGRLPDIYNESELGQVVYHPYTRKLFTVEGHANSDLSDSGNDVMIFNPCILNYNTRQCHNGGLNEDIIVEASEADLEYVLTSLILDRTLPTSDTISIIEGLKEGDKVYHIVHRDIWVVRDITSSIITIDRCASFSFTVEDAFLPTMYNTVGLTPEACENTLLPLPEEVWQEYVQ